MSQTRSPKDGAPAASRPSGSEHDILHELLRSTPDVGMIALDLDGRILEWNAGAELLYGYSPSDILQLPLSTLFPRDFGGRKSAREMVEEAIRSGRAEALGWRLKKDGLRFWARDVLTLLHGENGKCIGLGLIVHDLAGHPESRKALQNGVRGSRGTHEARDDLSDGRAMLGSIRDASGEIVDFEFLYADAAWKRALRALDETLSGARLREQEPEALAGALFPRYVEVVEGGDTLEEELHFPHDDGADWFRITATRVGDGVALTLANLTRVRRADRALRETESRYLQAQKMESLGRLAGGVAHDVNNMLTAIMINAHLLLQQMPQDDPQRAYSEEIGEIAGHAASLTQQILEYGARKAPEPRVLDLNRVVSAVVAMLRRLIGENIKLATVLEPDLKPVRADPIHLQQVLLNLVLNARDAMPGGGRITIETRRPELRGGEEDRVMMSVRDTGIGMDLETQARIFEPFFTTKETGKGTGLGLATVDTIIRKCGGRVEVESAPGRGSSFRVYLPSAQGRDADREGREGREEDSVEGSGSGNETILVVEDDQVVRGAIGSLLERRGYRVIEASTGTGALWRCQQHDGMVHLLIADVRMPGMSGRQLARKLRVLRPELRVLFISGYSRDDAMPRGEEADAMFLAKPFSPLALARAVHRSLDRAEKRPVTPRPPEGEPGEATTPGAPGADEAPSTEE